MGTLCYGETETEAAIEIEIDDRTLAHLKVVIVTKLRRGESFTLTWRHPEGQPPGRSVIWLSPAIPLRFVFDDPEPIELNHSWIKDLASAAYSSGGIALSPEDVDVSPVGPRDNHDKSAETSAPES